MKVTMRAQTVWDLLNKVGAAQIAKLDPKDVAAEHMASYEKLLNMYAGITLSPPLQKLDMVNDIDLEFLGMLKRTNFKDAVMSKKKVQKGAVAKEHVADES